MRIYGFDEYGPAEVEHFADVPDPVAAPGTVLVRTTAAGVNPADIKVRAGQRIGKVEVVFPMAMGREAAGVVVDDPSGQFQPGQAVFGSCASGTGAFAELVLLEAAQTCRVPDGVSAEQAAVIPVGVGTAWDALIELGISRGDTLLVLGAAGGVGVHAVLLGRHLGATVLGLARDERGAVVTEHGATHVSSEDGWVERLRELVPDGPTAVLDTVGGPLLEQAAALLGDPTRLRSTASPAKAKELGGSGVTRRRDAAVYEELAAFVAAGTLTPVIGRSLPFDEASHAAREVASGHGVGRTVVTF